ncbi:MAG: hypothetical protein KAS99_04880 [Candidatus Omnitrophica bacterium]|nr:hypothetical protein [Candidatus Omnitrophota bacterium]
MRKFIMAGIFFLMLFGTSFSQVDNIYGGYLVSKSRKKISMDLENVSLIDLLKVFSQQSGLNFVSTEAVKDRSITLYIENAPLNAAMDVIFEANNLAYDYYSSANMFIVKEMGKPGIELKTKVYKLKYVRVKNTRLQEEIEDILGSGESEETEEGGIKAAVKEILTEYGKVIEDPLTNSLIVVDVPSQFPVIDEIIGSLDMAQPKVLIEVEMLDVSKILVDKLGFNFANGLNASFKGGTYQTVFPFPKRFLQDIAWTTTPGRQLTLGTMDLSLFTVLMEYLTTDSGTKFLARPKILTLSNETSEVNLTTDEAIGITTIVSEEGTTQEIERTETGTKLRVTPQVNLDTREITLVLEVFNKSATPSELKLTGEIQGVVSNPEERGTKSVLRLKDKETLLIGGLIRNESNETITKVPFIGDIPLLGKLFTHKYKKAEERELLIFLTMRIVKDHLQFSRLPGEALLREQSMLYPREEAIKNSLDNFSK